MATRREPESESRVPDPGLEVSGPTDVDVPAPPLEAPAPVPGVLPVLPPLRPPLRGEARVMSDAELLERRVEHWPVGPVCAGCRHLGEPIPVSDRHGARRFRRRCARVACGFTAPDWPACAHFDARPSP